jgi:hypothetical protein
MITSGRSRPSPPFDADFGLKIGMFRKPAGFEHIAQLLFAPAPARLGGIAQGIAQFRCLCTHRFLPDAHRFHQALQIAIGFGPVLFDLGNRFLIALKPFIDRLEKRFERLARRFLRLPEPLVCPLEKLFLRLPQKAVANFGELGRQRILGFAQFGQPRLKTVMFGPKLHSVQLCRIALPNRSLQITDCSLEIFEMEVAFRLQRPGPAPSEQPADQSPQSEREKTQKCGDGQAHDSERRRNKSNRKAKILTALYSQPSAVGGAETHLGAFNQHLAIRTIWDQSLSTPRPPNSAELSHSCILARMLLSAL